MPIVIPQTLRHAFTLYADAHPRNKVADLRTVFRRYILLAIPGQKFTQEMIKNKRLIGCLGQISMIEFTRLDCRAILEKQLRSQVSNGNITQRTADNYVSDYDAFIHWIKLQNWYEAACGNYDGRFAPRLTTRRIGSLLKARTGKGRNCRTAPYQLKPEGMTSYLIEQLEEYSCFWTDKEVENRQDDALRPITCSKHKKNILYFLGWLKSIEGETVKLKVANGQKLTSEEQSILESLGALSLEPVANLSLLKRFVAWGINKRSNKYGWAETVAKASLSVAKFLHAEGAPNDYRGVETVDQLRRYINIKLTPKAKAEAESADTTSKEMTHEQCVAVAQRLRQACAPKRAKAHRRSIRAILLSWQRYLIIAILTYCPLRSRELRELELNKTLFKEKDGYWLKLKPEYSKTGKPRKVNLTEWLPANVIADLDEWLTIWRPQAKVAIQDFEKWLAFWDYDKNSLDFINDSLQKARELRSKAYIQQLEAQLRGIQNLIEIWQNCPFHSDHNYVFFCPGSPKHPETVFRPYGEEDPERMSDLGTYFGRLVKTAVFRTTGLLVEENHPLFIGAAPKHTHPHFFRHIDSTHLRRQGASHEVLKAFHEGIGNSIEEGDRSYDLMAPEERTAAAARWWAPNEPQDDDEKAEIIKKLLFELPPERRRIIKDWI